MPLAPAPRPFPVTAPHRVAPSPRPVDRATLGLGELDADWPAVTTRRLERWEVEEDRCLVRWSGADERQVAAAVRAVWGMTPWATGRLPHLGLQVDLDRGRAREVGPSLAPAATLHLLHRDGPDLLLRAWLLAGCEDLVVLRADPPAPEPTRDAVCELLAVSLPSGWSPRERAGAGLGALHAPVADGEVLRAATPALAAALLRKGPLQQWVWGLAPDGRLDREPGSTPVRDVPPEQWWLRVERQALLPLPALDRAAFAIRPTMQPLVELAAGRRALLADALVSMSPAAAAYKGVAQVRDELVAWLRA